MNFEYRAIHDDRMVGEVISHDSRKIKDKVKVTICVEVEKSKLDSLNQKYTDGLGGRILKLFK